MKNKKVNREKILPAGSIRDRTFSARVKLAPSTSNGAEVQEKVTRANIVDTGRYLRWAAKAMADASGKEGKCKTI